MGCLGAITLAGLGVGAQTGGSWGVADVVVSCYGSLSRARTRSPSIPLSPMDRYEEQWLGAGGVLPGEGVVEAALWFEERADFRVWLGGRCVKQEGVIMTLSFTNPREPQGVEDLSLIEAKQLGLAGSFYDGEELTAGQRLGEDPDIFEESSFLGFLDLWDVVDEEGRVVYTAFLYMVDSGTFFKAGTLEHVAEVIQGYLDTKNEALYASLADAIRRAREADPTCWPRISTRS